MGAKKDVDVMQVVQSMIRDNPDVARAFAAMQQRGMSSCNAEKEIARAIVGCVWEASCGLPDRWPAVLEGLEDGKSVASLFPDGIYSGPGYDGGIAC